MSHGRLKASTKRAQTSTALQGNATWTDTIGLAQDVQAGSNAAVEASLSASLPGGGRAARHATEAALNSGAEALAEAEREGSPDLSRPLHFLSEGARARLAQALSKGGFDSAVNSYEGLLTLARSQGAVGGQNRGACKNCGQLGHLTKQCRNHLSTHFNQPQPPAVPSAAAAQPLPKANGSSSLSDLSSSNDDSGLSSGSSSEEQQQKRRHHKRKHAEAAASGKAGKKQKKSKHKHKHGKKHKRRRKD